MKTWTRRLGCVSSVLVVALLVAACGSSSDTTNASSAAGTEGSGSTDGSPIVLGMALAEHGLNGPSLGPSADVATAWEEWVNHEGGIDGRPVEIVVKDMPDDSASQLRTANELVQDDHIVAEVGGADSGNDSIWTKALTGAKVPIIGGPLIEDEVMSSSPYLFALSTPVSTVYKLMILSAKEAGATKFGAVVCGESPACAAAGEIWQAEAKQVGIGWGGLLQITAAEPTYTAACQALEESGSDFVEIGVYPQIAERVFGDCSKQGFEPKYYGLAYNVFEGSRFGPISETGINFSGVLGSVPWWLPIPAVKQYRRVMTEFSPEHKIVENQAQTSTWTALEMFRKAMEDAKTEPTAEGIVEAMDQVKEEDLGGLLPEKVTFTKGQPSPLFECGWVGTLMEGKFTGGKTLCTSS